MLYLVWSKRQARFSHTALNYVTLFDFAGGNTLDFADRYGSREGNASQNASKAEHEDVQVCVSCSCMIDRVGLCVVLIRVHYRSCSSHDWSFFTYRPPYQVVDEMNETIRKMKWMSRYDGVLENTIHKWNREKREREGERERGREREAGRLFVLNKWRLGY